MKLKREFVLREIAGDTLLVPAGKTALDLNGMITLNEVAADIWRMLPDVEDEDAIVRRILDDYDAEETQVRRDVDAFLGQLRELGVL